MCNLLPLTSHTRLGTIEDWRGFRRAVASPVPVWLRAIVPTLDPQRILIRKGEVPVPGEEVACSVNGHGVLHVDGNEIIVAGLRSWVLRSTELRRRLGDAGNSGYVCLLFSCRDIAPVDVSIDDSEEFSSETERRTIPCGLAAYP